MSKQDPEAQSSASSATKEARGLDHRDENVSSSVKVAPQPPARKSVRTKNLSQISTWVVAVSSVCIVLLTAGYVYFSYQLWKVTIRAVEATEAAVLEARRSNDLTETSIDQSLLQAQESTQLARGSLEESRESNELTTRSVHLAEESLRLSQRALKDQLSIERAKLSPSLRFVFKDEDSDWKQPYEVVSVFNDGAPATNWWVHRAEFLVVSNPNAVLLVPCYYFSTQDFSKSSEGLVLTLESRIPAEYSLSNSPTSNLVELNRLRDIAQKGERGYGSSIQVLIMLQIGYTSQLGTKVEYYLLSQPQMNPGTPFAGGAVRLDEDAGSKVLAAHGRRFPSILNEIDGEGWTEVGGTVQELGYPTEATPAWFPVSLEQVHSSEP